MTLILVAIALAVLTPGPANLAIMATAMARGRPAGIVFAFGVQAGSAFWAVMAAVGLSVWLETVAYGLTAMKIAGGLYLLFLAFKSLRSALAPTDHTAAATVAGSGTALFARGAALHLTNPKAVLSWLAVTALIKATPDVQLWPALGACLLVSGAIFQLYALVFSLPVMARAWRRCRRTVEALLAMVFGYAGARLIAG